MLMRSPRMPRFPQNGRLPTRLLPDLRLAEAGWFAALHLEDCVRVLELLRADPYLLTVGRSEDTRRVVERPRSGRDFWKGRTALHVGARRGSVDLVKAVLGMLDDGSRLEAFVERPGVLLGDLLAAKDGWYKLDALAMAVVNGNRDIMQILAKASLEKSETNPYEISSREEAQAESPSLDSTSLERARMKLREITTEVMENLQVSMSTNADSLKVLYRESCDFNFLPWEEYLFHFTFLKGPRQKFIYMDEVRHKIFDNTRSTPDVLRFLCELQDGQGRTALHVAVDEETVMHFLLLIPQVPAALFSPADSKGKVALDSLVPQEDYTDFLNAADGTGRVALHRAAAMTNPESLRFLMSDNRISLNANYNPWEYTKVLWLMGINLEIVSKNNGFKGTVFDIYDFSNSLHIAIIHKRIGCVDLLLDDRLSSSRAEDYKLDLKFPFTRVFEMRTGERRRLALQPLQLAAIVADVRILEMLLQNKSLKDLGRPSNWSSSNSSDTDNPTGQVELLLPAVKPWEAPWPALHLGRPSNWSSSNSSDTDNPTGQVQLLVPVVKPWEAPWPALHLVAASGKFELLKLFMNNKNYDLMVQDPHQNTTLHHATKGREFQFSPELIDHFHCEHAGESIRGDEGNQARGRREDVERKGCIELLLQAGFDIWKTNQANQAPYPGPDASVEILSWWYEKLAKETIALQSTLNGAANAISVTAALVATASFQGPLQPPLGWSSTTNLMQVSSLPVRVFIVCDTLSFYLAVAAIISALMPSLPMSQESTLDELRRTRKMVTVAVGFLFPSIMSIVIAFGAASIAVIPSGKGSWNDGGLTITTTIIGGVICLGVICLFFFRLLGLVFYRNARLRTLFKATLF